VADAGASTRVWFSTLSDIFIAVDVWTRLLTAQSVPEHLPGTQFFFVLQTSTAKSLELSRIRYWKDRHRIVIILINHQQCASTGLLLES